MTSKLKALSLALVAAFAMSAVVASMAQANQPAEFWAAEDNATIDVTAENTQEFTVEGLPTLTCADVHGAAVLEEEGPTLTGDHIETEYTTCHVVSLGITFPVTVDMNDCHYEFHAGTYIGSGTEGDGTAHGSANVKCPGEADSITVTVFNTDHATVRCEIHVPEQAVKGQITFENETTEGKMAVTITSHGSVEATVTDFNTVGCNEHITDPEAEYRGSSWAKATDATGALIDTTVTGAE